MRYWFALALCASVLIAGEKKAPQGHEEDESVAISAAIVSSEQLERTFLTGFGGNYTVVDVTITPKGSKPYYVRLDDFTLRSESSLEHSGPMSAGQIAGSGAIVVERTYGNRANVDSPRPLQSTKIETKDDAKADPAFETLKQKILVEKNITGPVSGLLFFPLSKEKPKNLVLSYKSPTSHLRLTFK